MEQPAAYGLFRSDFLDKGLVTFAECMEHYQTFEADALLDEMRRLLTAPMLAIPFSVSSARYFALMTALVRCAGTNRSLTDTQRAKLVRLCVDIGTFLRGRAIDKRMEAFDIVLASALDAVRGSDVFPGIADTIAAQLHAGESDEAFSPPGTTALPSPPLAHQEPPSRLPFAIAV